MSVRTGRPDSACSVSGVTKRQAAAVMQTSTAMSALTKSRVSSAALYAAMPPVRPRTILESGLVSIIPMANAGATARSLHCLGLAMPRGRRLRGWHERASSGAASHAQSWNGRRTSVRANDCWRAALRRCRMPSSSRCCCAPAPPGTSALDIARALIARFDGVAGLLAAPVAEVAAVRGVGPAKGAELATVVELARRSLSQEARRRDALASPQAVRDYLRLLLAARPYEVFVGLFLDSQNRLLAADELFRGTLAQTSVYPREVVKAALARNAAAMIFAHNHPSGVAEPSRADELLTQALKQALALVDIRTLDHFVVAGGRLTSFAERGLL